MRRDIGNEVIVAIAVVGVLAFALMFAIVLSLSSATPVTTVLEPTLPASAAPTYTPSQLLLRQRRLRLLRHIDTDPADRDGVSRRIRRCERHARSPAQRNTAANQHNGDDHTPVPPTDYAAESCWRRRRPARIRRFRLPQPIHPPIPCRRQRRIRRAARLRVCRNSNATRPRLCRRRRPIRQYTRTADGDQYRNANPADGDQYANAVPPTATDTRNADPADGDAHADTRTADGNRYTDAEYAGNAHATPCRQPRPTPQQTCAADGNQYPPRPIPTATNTATHTPVPPTATNTPTRVHADAALTPTVTYTATNTATPTLTPTNTPTFTPSATQFVLPTALLLPSGLPLPTASGNCAAPGGLDDVHRGWTTRSTRFRLLSRVPSKNCSSANCLTTATACARHDPLRA